MTITITTGNPPRDAIAAFVAGHASATLGHDPRWLSVMSDGLRHTDASLTAMQDGAIVGWLPLVQTSSLLFGRHLVSLPYLNEAGCLAADHDAESALLNRAVELARERRVSFVELRHRTAVRDERLTAVRTDKVRMVLPLPGAVDALWSAIPSKARNQVRKGQGNDLTVQFGGAELLPAFYRVFAVNMRDLGTPVFPRRLFASILHHLQGDAELCVVEHAGEPVAGALLVHGRGVTEVPSASSLRAFNGTCANMLMYYHLLERAVKRGATAFDFGRSTIDSGTYGFKKQWGAAPQPTGWQHLPLKTGARPITKEDDRYARATEVWKRLPVWVTRLVGPPIVRGIP